MLPKIVHQTWKTREVPEKWKEGHQRWSNFCEKNGYEHRLWTDADNRDLIATSYPWFLKKYDSYEYNIQRADAVRYFILHKFGGVYSDLDFSPTDNDKVHELICKYGNGEAPSAVPETCKDMWVYRDKYSNFFMISRPESAFMEEMFKSLKKPRKYFNTLFKNLIMLMDHFKVLLSTGPGIVSDQVLLNPDKVAVIPTAEISKKGDPSVPFENVHSGSWRDNSKLKRQCVGIATLTLILTAFIIGMPFACYFFVKGERLRV